MEIKILAHGNTNPEKVLRFYKTAKFYAKYLNIEQFKYKVYVCLSPNLRQKDSVNGLCSLTGDREISIAVDSKLDLLQSLQTLAHEMVHVKQYVRGHYRGELSRNGKIKRIWLGQQYTVEYTKRPWEREAFRREMELVHALLDEALKNAKKGKKVI